MPPRKSSANRSAGAPVRAVAANPYATPDPVLEEVVGAQTKPRVPVKKFITPAAAPMPEFRAHGHVLTDRGWVPEESEQHG